MITEATGHNIDRIFASLRQKDKSAVFDDMEIAGLRIELGTDSWHNYMRRKAKRTKGKLSKLYKLFSQFEKDDVEVFFNAFTEADKPLITKKNPVVNLLGALK